MNPAPSSPRRMQRRPVAPTPVSLEHILEFLCLVLRNGREPVNPKLQGVLDEACPILVSRNTAPSFWVTLVLKNTDLDQVVEAAAKAAFTASVWKVESSRDMTATSKMLRYRQPQILDIEPLPADESCDELPTLLTAVAQWHKGWLELILKKSHDEYSACDTSLACLESAQCRLSAFQGCLSGGSNSAWCALVESVKREERAGTAPLLSISLLDPRLHELGALDGTEFDLSIRARPSSGPSKRCPLPTGFLDSVRLEVDCRPAEGGEAPGHEETAALIEDLAPRDMKNFLLFLIHYPGLDDALDELVARLRATGVRTYQSDSSTRGWEEATRFGNGQCKVCADSSHMPGERCVRLKL